MKKVDPGRAGLSIPPLRRITFLAVTGMFFMLCCPVAYSFDSGSLAGHTGATEQGLKAVSYKASNGEILKFTFNATHEIADADDEVDAGGGFMQPVPHCDNEELVACSSRVLALRAQVVAAVSNPDNRDGTAARRFLGQALHTVQDFYAHSNWVNNPGPAHTSYNRDLGVAVIPQLRKDQQTCVDDIMNDNVLIAFGLTDITTGYFGITPAGKCAHGIISGAGINKDYPGRPFYKEAFRQAIEATTAYVNLIIQDLHGDEDAIRVLLGLENPNEDLSVNPPSVFSGTATNEDMDGDGIIDSVDSCLDSNLSPTIVIESCDTNVANVLVKAGCTINDLLHAAAAAEKNHESFVYAAAHIAYEAKSLKLINGPDSERIVDCAKKSGNP